MNYVLFVVGSVIEYFALTTLMLVAHRIEMPRRRILELLGLAILMSQVSYFTRMVVGEASSYIQLGLTVLAVWLIFNIPLFYSAVMNVISMAFGFIGQGLLILAISFGVNVPFGTVVSDPDFAFPTQVLSMLLFLTVSYVIKTYNVGFNYVPTSRRDYVELRGLNVVILTAIIVIITALSVASVALRNDFDTYLYVVVGVFALSIPLFLYYSLRKDNEDAEKSRRIITRSNGRAGRKSL